MSGHGTKLKRKLAEAVAAVLTARSVEDAARSVSVSTAMLMRWQKLPEFQAALREARRAAFGQVIARLTQASGAAASILLKIVVDEYVGIRPGTGHRQRAGPLCEVHRDRRHRGASNGFREGGRCIQAGTVRNGNPGDRTYFGESKNSKRDGRTAAAWCPILRNGCRSGRNSSTSTRLARNTFRLRWRACAPSVRQSQTTMTAIPKVTRPELPECAKLSDTMNDARKART